MKEFAPRGGQILSFKSGGANSLREFAPPLLNSSRSKFFHLRVLQEQILSFKSGLHVKQLHHPIRQTGTQAS